jgi:hypothetical protein
MSVQRKFALIFICIPVSPGSSRLIWTFPRNFGIWIDKVVPRWMFHVGQNLILDSDLYLLHVEVIPISYVIAYLFHLYNPFIPLHMTFSFYEFKVIGKITRSTILKFQGSAIM